MRNFLLCAIVVSIAGCGAQSNGAAEPFSVSISPGIAGEPNRIEVQDSDANAPTIEADINMADMPMPKRVTLEQSSAGRYKVDGVDFSMSGDWTVVVHDHAGRKSTVHIR